MDWNWSAFIAMFLLFISADRVAGGEETPMAYEVLQQYPIGHLPKGATGYELNNLTGNSKAYLGEGTCSFSVEGSYDLKYKSTIKERGWAGVIGIGGDFVGEFQDGEFLGLPAVWLWIEAAAVGLEGTATAEGGGERGLSSYACSELRSFPLPTTPPSTWVSWKI